MNWYDACRNSALNANGTRPGSYLTARSVPPSCLIRPCRRSIPARHRFLDRWAHLQTFDVDVRHKCQLPRRTRPECGLIHVLSLQARDTFVSRPSSVSPGFLIPVHFAGTCTPLRQAPPDRLPLSVFRLFDIFSGRVSHRCSRTLHTWT